MHFVGFQPGVPGDRLGYHPIKVVVGVVHDFHIDGVGDGQESLELVVFVDPVAVF